MVSLKPISGTEHGDAACDYEVVLNKPCTVGELIRFIISTKSNEWGYIGIGDAFYFRSPLRERCYPHSLRFARLRPLVVGHEWITTYFYKLGELTK